MMMYLVGKNQITNRKNIKMNKEIQKAINKISTKKSIALTIGTMISCKV